MEEEDKGTDPNPGNKIDSKQNTRNYYKTLDERNESLRPFGNGLEERDCHMQSTQSPEGTELNTGNTGDALTQPVSRRAQLCRGEL